MSIQKIAATAKDRLDEIEARCPTFWSDLSVNEVSGVLQIVSDAFESLNQLARESADAEESKLLTPKQMKHILCLFGELHENFFPMAHTQAPLDDLIIINGRKSEELLLFQRYGIERLSREIEDRITELEWSNEEMKRVFNP